MIPSLGRIVHYVARGSADGRFPRTCRTAIVTEVEAPSMTNDGQQRVGLMVVNPTGLFFHSLADGGCGYDGNTDEPVGGTWHWPERV
jgi:hypothetical protein